MSDQGSIFLSYSRAQVRQVEEVALKLRGRGHAVFFDGESLGAENFDTQIPAQIKCSRLFVFFVSADSVRLDAYARTELEYAKRSWPNPDGRVLAIRTDGVAIGDAPAYLRALTTIHDVAGHFATGAVNLIEAALGPSLNAAAPANAPKRDLLQTPVEECAGLLVEALSRRRGLPHSGTATREVAAEIDDLVRTIKSRFKPDEGAVVAGARLVKVIGVGNFGTVWEAEDVETRTPVAVKIFRLERLAEGQMLFRFRKSIRAMRLLGEQKRLSRSSAAAGTIVNFLRADPTELAFSMELLPNGSLDDIANRGWTLEHKLDLCTRVCAAVAYSHANGVIHRDIKPANIVLNVGGQAVLTDFDIADIKFATSMSTTVEGGLGTPVFAAPEQLVDADRADERSDVYSLGRLLHYMLLERSPGYQVEKDPTLENIARFPAAIVELVRRATQHDPRRRFASVREFHDALLKSRTGAAAWNARVARLSRWLRHNWAAVTIVALLVGGSGTTAVLMSRAAARERWLSGKLTELTDTFYQSIRAKDAAVDRVASITAELQVLHASPPSVDRDQLIVDAEGRLIAAKRTVTELASKQAELSKQLAEVKAAASGGETPEARKLTKPPAANKAKIAAPVVSAVAVERTEPEVASNPEPDDQNAEFDDLAAARALDRGAAAAAANCGKAGGVADDVPFMVTFSGDGLVTNMFSQAPLDAEQRACIARVFKNVRVPPFRGFVKSVPKTVKILRFRTEQ